MHRTTSHAQVLSDATAGVDCTAAPTKAAASAKLKAFIAFSIVIEIYAHITMRGKGKPKTQICCCIVCRGPIGYGHPHIRNRARPRSEERRVGKECGSTGRCRGERY